ncbi:MAG: hypothetical protein WC284_17930 [Candidimonas sp.]
MIEIDSSVKDLYNLAKNDMIIDKTLLSDITSNISYMESLKEPLQTLASTASPAQQAEIDDFIQGLDQSIESMTQMRGHVSTQLTDLPQNLSAYTSMENINQATNGDFFAELCTGINDFFGSILGFVGDVISEITNIIGQVFDLILQGIEAVLAVIQELTNRLLTLAAKVIEQIAKEVSALIEMLSDLADFSFASSLGSIFDHPCAKTILGAVGTGAAIAVLTR